MQAVVRWTRSRGAGWVFLATAFACVLFAGGAVAATDGSGAPPTIVSDKGDYVPGEIVTLTGSGWQPGETVHLVVNDDQGKTWSHSADVVADDSGGVSDQFQLPGWFVAVYSITATGSSSGTITSSFTDAALKATIDSAVPSLLGPANSFTDVTWHANGNGTYSVRVGGSSCTTGTQVDSGNYTTQPATLVTRIAATALAEGANTVRVCVTVSTNTDFDVVTVTKDTTAPVAPSVTSSAPLSPANNMAPKIIGSAEAASTVKLFTNATCTSALAGSGTAAAFASPGITVAVADNTTTTFYATATDAAGNTSACSSTSVTYVEDSTAPGMPTVTSVSPAPPANNNSPTITGSADAGSTVKLYTNATCTSAVAATGTAAAFASPGLTVSVGNNSTTTFYATATDAAGNPSPCSTSSVTYVEDSTAPALPTLTTTSPASPASTNSLNVIGSAEAGSTVTLYTNSTCTSAVAASGTAAIFASPGLSVSVTDNSSTTFRATATDAAGNVSGCSSSSITYVEDSNAPVAPSVTSSAPLSPANNNAPKIIGSAEAASTVKLYTNATCTSTVAGSGTAAAFASPGLAVTVAHDSTTSFYATATDAAGNISACSSGAVTYVEDSTPPPPPTLTSTSPASPA
ncbi:MAG: hypothetical protein QOE91_612, partial [Gaiellaceae bacterium]|nr:hypothetical protein [Gaiellaceae bacterium]